MSFALRRLQVSATRSLRSVLLGRRTFVRSAVWCNDKDDGWYEEFDADAFATRKEEEQRPNRAADDDDDIGHDYIRLVDDRAEVKDVDEVNRLLADRDAARGVKDFDTADAIRDDLYRIHGVRASDRDRTWWVDRDDDNGSSSSSSATRMQQRRRGLAFGPNGHDYTVSDDAGPNVSRLSDDDIHARLAARLQAKLARDFVTADAIQVELMGAGVFVHDALKEFRADGRRYPQVGRKGINNDVGRRPLVPYVHDAAEGDDATDHERQIQALVDRRAQCKRDGDYEQADAIRDDLRTVYNVRVNDKLRSWSVGRVPS